MVPRIDAESKAESKSAKIPKSVTKIATAKKLILSTEWPRRTLCVRGTIITGHVSFIPSISIGSAPFVRVVTRYWLKSHGLSTVRGGC